MNINHESSLKEKVAIVTGASRGIGRAIAIKIGQMGAHLILNYSSSEFAAQETLDLVTQAGAASAILVKADVGKQSEAQNLIDVVLSKYQRIDVLVNNAGIQRAVLLHKMTDSDWHDVINTNLNSVFYLCRAVLPSMLANRSGHILNIGSGSGYMAHKGASSYVASKHALVGLTKVLALETADKGIQVNSIAPGATDTDMIRSLPEAGRERLISGIPMKRIGQVEEIAAMAVFVLTEATFSTGNTFHASGGYVSN